jgi:hypothetical protein
MVIHVKHPEKQPLDRHLDDDGEKFHRPASSHRQARRELGFELIEAEREEQERVKRQIP